MSGDPQEIDGSQFTHGGSNPPWPTVTVYSEWEIRDLGGRVVTRGPIVDGVIFGGPEDGRRVAPSRPPSHMNVRFAPGSFTLQFGHDESGPTHEG